MSMIISETALPARRDSLDQWIDLSSFPEGLERFPVDAEPTFPDYNELFCAQPGKKDWLPEQYNSAREHFMQHGFGECGPQVNLDSPELPEYFYKQLGMNPEEYKPTATEPNTAAVPALPPSIDQRLYFREYIKQYAIPPPDSEAVAASCVQPMSITDRPPPTTTHGLADYWIPISRRAGDGFYVTPQEQKRFEEWYAAQETQHMGHIFTTQSVSGLGAGMADIGDGRMSDDTSDDECSHSISGDSNTPLRSPYTPVDSGLSAGEDSGSEYFLSPARKSAHRPVPRTTIKRAGKRTKAAAAARASGRKAATCRRSSAVLEVHLDSEHSGASDSSDITSPIPGADVIIVHVPRGIRSPKSVSVTKLVDGSMKCPFSGCTNSTKNANDMRRHLQSLAHADKHYRCDRCPQSFTRSDALKRHRLNVHKLNVH